MVGFKGNDVLQGGDGNDVLVWNNGDATDRDEGGNGVDEVEVNGAPTVGDQFNAKPDAEKPGFVFFERSNLVKFSIESQAERLTVNGLGGEDQFIPDPAAPTGLAGLTALTLNGGSAGDRLVGGDGADQINGGSGADELFGGEGADQINGGDENDDIKGDGGDDRIVGGTGSDSLKAEAGDDAIVWNNGDGSDPVNEGGAGFDRVEVNGSATAGDATQFDRRRDRSVLRADEPRPVHAGNRARQRGPRVQRRRRQRHLQGDRRRVSDDGGRRRRCGQRRTQRRR